MSSPAVILYFPYKGVGGVSALFLRMAEALRDRHDVHLVDFKDGYMGSRIPDGVHLVDIRAVERYPANSVCVFQSLAPWNIVDAYKFDPATRCVFWNLHPDNLFPYIYSVYSDNPCKRALGLLLQPLSLQRRRKLEKVADYLSSSGSLLFMDRENYEKTASFLPNARIQERILPLLTGSHPLAMRRYPRTPLHCCWIGRIVDFKAPILIHLLRRLDAAVERAGDMELAVVGNGEMLDAVRSVAADLARLRVRFIGELPMDRIGGFLESEVDVLFAMGTSALEGAGRGIPTFLLDYSYRRIAGTYRFRYIYQAERYSGGRQIRGEDFEAVSSLEEALIDLRANYTAHAERCRVRWQESYSPDAVCGLFEQYVARSTATFEEMRRRGFFTADPVSRVLKKAGRAVRPQPERVDGFGRN